MEIARRQNPALLAAERGVQASLLQYRNSFNGLMPHVSLSNSYSNSDTLNSLGHYTNADNWEESANASLDLFNAQDYASMSTSKAQEMQAKANLAQVSAQVRLTLAEAFIKLIYNEQRVAVDGQIEDIQKTNAQMVSLEYKSGQESKGDMMTSQAQYLQAQVTVSNDLLNIRAAKMELNNQLGQDQFSDIEVTGTLDYSKLPLPDFPSLVAQTPQVAVAEAAVILSRAGLETSEVSLWPDFSATASRFYNGNTEFPHNPHWSWGASLSLPIFGSGPTAAYYQISAAKESLAQAEENLRASRDSTRSLLEQDWTSLNEDADLVAANRDLFAAAQQRYTESTIRYNAGIMPFETWILSVSDLINFKQGYLGSELNAALSEAQWNNAVGKGLPWR